MQLTRETLILFLVLMPGFLSSIILNALIVRKAPDGLVLVIEALVFSFVIYALWGLGSGHFLFTVGVPDGTIQWAVTRRSIGGVIVISVLLPVVLGTLITHDYLFRFLEKLGVTRKTGRSSVWLDVFVEQRRCVIVNFKDGRRLFGWPEFYSDDVNEGMLFLSDAAWLDDDGKYHPLLMRGHLIVDRSSIGSITFTHIGYNNAEFETYGEQSSPQADYGRTESPSDQRAESAPEPTDQTAPAPTAPTTEEGVKKFIATIEGPVSLSVKWERDRCA